MSRRVLATDTCEFRFAPTNDPGLGHDRHAGPDGEHAAASGEAELRFRPGQFVSVQVGIDQNDNPILRSYSIASRGASAAPGKGPQPLDLAQPLSLILRLVPGGIGSKFFDGLHPGDTIRFTGPMGFFVNELQHAGDAVYVATGTGIAPILPMLDETLDRPEPGRALLYWGCRNEDDLFWQDEIASLVSRHPRFSAYLYLSQPRTGLTRLRGRVTGPVLEALPTLRTPTFYLCGNGKMIDELKAALVSRGVDRKRQIRTEAFFD